MPLSKFPSNWRIFPWNHILALTFFPREKNQCQFPSNWRVFNRKCSFPPWIQLPNITLSCFSYLDCIRKELYLANYVEILLHNHFSGCIEIANPLGIIFFIPRGFAPWDEMNPRDWQFQCIPRNDRAIILCSIHLNIFQPMFIVQSQSIFWSIKTGRWQKPSL